MELVIALLGVACFLLFKKNQTLKEANSETQSLENQKQDIEAIQNVEINELKQLNEDLEKEVATQNAEIKKLQRTNNIITDLANSEIKNLKQTFDEKIEKKSSQIKAFSQENELIKEKYAPILSMDLAVEMKGKQLKKLKQEAVNFSIEHAKLKELLGELKQEVKLYQEDIELIEHGAYNPYFDFDTSEEYKDQLTDNKEEQKWLIKLEKAAICKTEWTVGGDRKKGEVMTKKAIKLTLKAFNGDCNTLINKVKWNNVEQSKKRMEKSFEVINKLNEANHIEITESFLNFKIQELRLVHELEQKKKEEKEEQKRIKQEMREEEKLKTEIEREKRKNEQEELKFQQALEDAQRKLEETQQKQLEELNDELSKFQEKASEQKLAKEQELNKMNEEVLKLQQQLAEAQISKERAMSRAQLTKSGHVYIISNIGSFGQGIYKIGMTRRLEPMNRVKELSDASVPFSFDVHAMIYSENAPELENILHKAFTDRRVNMVNMRKEYFRVSLQEIQNVVHEATNAQITLTKIAEAKEYRETLALQKEVAMTLN